MPTLLEIELRAQLKRRDERINQLERKLEHAENQHGELLAALEALVNDFGRDGYGGEFEDGECRVIDMARAAIASVKGGA